MHYILYYWLVKYIVGVSTVVICDFVLRGFIGRCVACCGGAGAPPRGNTGPERGNMGYGTEEQYMSVM